MSAISWAIIDAWRVHPPCEYSEPYCSPSCPWHYECFAESEDEDEDEENDI